MGYLRFFALPAWETFFYENSVSLAEKNRKRGESGRGGPPPAENLENGGSAPQLKMYLITKCTDNKLKKCTEFLNKDNELQ